MAISEATKASVAGHKSGLKSKLNAVKADIQELNNKKDALVIQRDALQAEIAALDLDIPEPAPVEPPVTP